jgi:hypothetical protein
MQILLEYSPKDKKRILNLLVAGFKRYGQMDLVYFDSEITSFKKLNETLNVYSYIEYNKKVIIKFCFTRGKELDLKAIGIVQKASNYFFKIEDTNNISELLKKLPKYILNNEEFPGGVVIPEEESEPVLDVEEKKDQDFLTYAFRNVNHILQMNFVLKKVLDNYKVYNPIILAGTPGIGKTFLVTDYLKNKKNLVEGKNLELTGGGSLSPTVLVEILRKYSKLGEVVVIDEADETMDNNENSNILKLALGENGKISRQGQSTPYEGTVILISNKTTDWIISKLGAVIDRGYVIEYLASDEEIKEYITLISKRIAKKIGLNPEELKTVLDWFFANYKNLKQTSKKGLSIRTFEKVAKLYLKNPNSWKYIAVKTL